MWGDNRVWVHHKTYGGTPNTFKAKAASCNKTTTGHTLNFASYVYIFILKVKNHLQFVLT
jgi:hypothetical protein